MERTSQTRTVPSFRTSNTHVDPSFSHPQKFTHASAHKHIYTHIYHSHVIPHHFPPTPTPTSSHPIPSALSRFCFVSLLLLIYVIHWRLRRSIVVYLFSQDLAFLISFHSPFSVVCVCVCFPSKSPAECTPRYVAVHPSSVTCHLSFVISSSCRLFMYIYQCYNVFYLGIQIYSTKSCHVLYV